MEEKIVLHSLQTDCNFGFMPEAIVTTSRVTIGSETHSLVGTERIAFEVTQKRDFSDVIGTKLFLFGCLMIVVGLLLLIIPPLGILVIALGCLPIHSARQSPFQTVWIYLCKGNKRELVYTDKIGSRMPGDWKIYANDEECLNKVFDDYDTRLGRAHEIAQALGTAIGQKAAIPVSV